MAVPLRWDWRRRGGAGGGSGGGGDGGSDGGGGDGGGVWCEGEQRVASGASGWWRWAQWTEKSDTACLLGKFISFEVQAKGDDHYFSGRKT